jgi:DUF971 family protein
MSTPTRVVVSEHKQTLTIDYKTGESFALSAEYLRVFSPSAEVRGHGQGQETLQFGKRDVRIASIVQSGNYAIQIIFDDGHDSGIYSWDYLRKLAIEHDRLWSEYLEKIHRAGVSRDADSQVIKLS